MPLRSLSTLALLLVASLTAANPAAPIADLLARADDEGAHEVAADSRQREPSSAAAADWSGASTAQMALRSGMFKAVGLAGEVQQRFERAVELDPRHWKAHFAIPPFHQKAPSILRGHRDEARAIASRIRALSPTAGRRAQARLHAQEQDGAGDIAEMRQALALEPVSPEQLGVIAAYQAALAIKQRLQTADEEPAALRESAG
jgi:hypothetical protein